METLKLWIGDYRLTREGREEDHRRPVTFVGEWLCSRTEGDTRGLTEDLYKTEAGEYIVHQQNWSRWQGESDSARLVRVLAADLDVGGRFEFLGRAAGLARDLSLSEALDEGESS